MNISNKNNGRMGQTLHQKSTGSKGAVAALARRGAHIMSHGGTEDHLLCDYFQTETWEAVHIYCIMALVRGRKNIKLQELGIDPDLIRANSLRAEGAMTLNIMVYNNSTIGNFGRWTSDTWHMYIHRQIAKLYKGVAKNIITPISYHNLAFIEPTRPVLVIA